MSVISLSLRNRFLGIWLSRSFVASLFAPFFCVRRHPYPSLPRSHAPRGNALHGRSCVLCAFSSKNIGWRFRRRGASKNRVPTQSMGTRNSRLCGSPAALAAAASFLIYFTDYALSAMPCRFDAGDDRPGGVFPLPEVRRPSGGHGVVAADRLERIAPAALAGGAGGRPSAGAACPVCGRPMVEIALPIRSSSPPLRLDVCTLCEFVWFDPREFESFPQCQRPGRASLAGEGPRGNRGARSPAGRREGGRKTPTTRPAPTSGGNWIPAMLGMPVEENAPA